MKKMTQEEVDAFIRGEGLIEIEVDDPAARLELAGILRKSGAYIATAEGTFKIPAELLEKLLDLGFEIQEVAEQSFH